MRREHLAREQMLLAGLAHYDPVTGEFILIEELERRLAQPGYYTPPTETKEQRRAREKAEREVAARQLRDDRVNAAVAAIRAAQAEGLDVDATTERLRRDGLLNMHGRPFTLSGVRNLAVQYNCRFKPRRRKGLAA